MVNFFLAMSDNVDDLDLTNIRYEDLIWGLSDRVE
jgi:hypothetical protein